MWPRGHARVSDDTLASADYAFNYPSNVMTCATLPRASCKLQNFFTLDAVYLRGKNNGQGPGTTLPADSTASARRDEPGVPAFRKSVMTNSILAAAYRQVGVPLDRLPYSESFEKLRVEVQHRSGESTTDQSLWGQLLRLRKDGQLPRLRR